MIVLSSVKIMHDGDNFIWGGQGSFLRSDMTFGE